MNAETPAQLPYNGEMLRWARKWRGRSLEEAGARIGVDSAQIADWENNHGTPTVKQARKLADFYGREFLEFFYDDAPTVQASKLVPDYRLHREAPDPRANREILEIQHWAEMQRINALGLFEDLGEQTPAFSADLVATLEDDVEAAAARAREILSFPLAVQQKMKYKDRQDFPNVLRAKMEDAGVLVLRENALSQFGVSGLTIVQFPLPIVVYAAEAPSRCAFTLIHEFAHIVLRESAISGGDNKREAKNHARRVEKWCDRFAAAFLVPKVALEELRPKPATPSKSINDDVLAAIARHFRISQHAMLIRLVDLEYVQEEYYWGIKRPQFLAEERGWRSGGIPKVWVSRIWNKVGHLYTGLVLEALGTGKIQPHQAQRYLDIKNPVHLTTIRQEFGGA